MQLTYVKDFDDSHSQRSLVSFRLALARVRVCERSSVTQVVLLTRSLETGWAERQLVALAKGLHSRGMSVTVLTFYPGGALRQELELAGVPVEDLGKRGRWDVLLFLIRLFHRLLTIRPQVIYSWLPTANTLAAVIGRLAGVPRIVWECALRT